MNKQLNFKHKYVPSSYPTNRKTVLLLHGTGENEESLIPIVEMILPDAAVLSPRGQIMENGMPRFFRRIAEGVPDLEDIKFQTQELAISIEAASKTYGLESNEVIALGYSNGANIALSVMLTYSELISKAALFYLMIPFVPENPPDLSNIGILITAGIILPGKNLIKLRILFLNPESLFFQLNS